MYGSTKNEGLRLQIANEVYTTASDRRSAARNDVLGKKDGNWSYASQKFHLGRLARTYFGLFLIEN